MPVIIKQKIHVGRHGYIINEVYGLSEGKDCLICMSAPKNTILLPCRHICLCSECSLALRSQTNKCPVCRAKIDSLLRIETQESDGLNLCSTPLPKISENKLSEIYSRASSAYDRSLLLSATVSEVRLESQHTNTHPLNQIPVLSDSRNNIDIQTSNTETQQN